MKIIYSRDTRYNLSEFRIINVKEFSKIAATCTHWKFEKDNDYDEKKMKTNLCEKFSAAILILWSCFFMLHFCLTHSYTITITTFSRNYFVLLFPYQISMKNTHVNGERKRSSSQHFQFHILFCLFLYFLLLSGNFLYEIFFTSLLDCGNW